MQKPRTPADPALVTGRLNVTDFVAARKEDIRVLERLVASAGSKSKKRAFQSLPRTERRRAASHDAKRVPRKHGLRKRAELENLHANARKLKTSARPRPPPKAPLLLDRVAFNEKAMLPPDGFGVRFADRQRNKIWLPTHIWHKKRAFVEKLGDYMVPVTATQKQYRRTHRLLANKDEPGVMAWDTSFYATLIVECDAAYAAFAEMLEPLMPGATAPLYRKGSKHWQGVFDHSGPVLVHWVHASKVAVICHPFLFDAIWDVFATAQASSVPLTMQDARYAIGSIDLLGPSALSVLADTLVPVPDSCNDAVIPYWDTLAAAGSPDILPSRSVLELLACDPRLFGKRYKRHSANISSAANLTARAPGKVHAGGVYDPELREASLRGLVDQSQIDLRKRDPVTFTPETDARIPVTVLTLDDGRIRVLLPRAWVLPAWLTIFTRKHAMIGGQKELHQLAFERQCPFYPVDYPHMVQSPEAVVDAPRTHSHRNKEIAKPSDVSAHQSLLAKMNLSIVRVTCSSRGTPEPGAAVYAISEAEAQAWSEAPFNKDNNFKAKPELQFLGVITSGGFNLVKARGTGIGLVQQPIEGYSAKYCMVSNKREDMYRLAEYQLVSAAESATVL